MGLGMIGFMGGLGKGLSEESAYLAKQDEADAAAVRQKDYQTWLLKTQNDYEVQREQRGEERTIRTEKRTDQRTEEAADRKFQRDQREAPTRRGMKVEDEKASARGKSEVAGETLETDVRVKRELTEAGQTEADRKLKGAQTEFYGQKGEALENGGGKMNPADKAELDGVQRELRLRSEAITKAKADGNWAGTPEQKAIEAELAGLRLRERRILERARGGGAAAPAGAPAPDPLGIRKPAAGAAPAAPRKSGGMIQAGGADQQAIYTGEWNKAQQQLANAKTDEERARAQTDLDALRREMGRIGMTPPGSTTAAAQPAPAPRAAAPVPAAPRPAPAAPAQAAAPADPTEALGRELDASRSELKALTEPSKRPGLAAGAAAREDYARKVETLREKVRQQEKRYADAVGNKGAAFVVQRP